MSDDISNAEQQVALSEKKPFDVDIYRREQSAKHAQMIDKFVEKRSLERKKYQNNGKTVLLLISSGDKGIESELVSKHIEQHVKELRRGMINHCFFIAERAIKDDIAVGRVSSPSGTSDFVGWRNHCINYSIFEDGSLLAFDLTASENINKRQGDFDILAIRATSLDKLLGMLNDLYGGEWVVMQNEG